MTVDRQAEWAVGTIQQVAFDHGVDALFLLALRCHEAGPPAAEGGHPFGEFGVPTAVAPDYATQLAVCAKTIRGYLVDFEAQPPAQPLLVLCPSHTGNRRACYSDAFIAYCARRYAPVGVANDPNNLNAFWADGVRRGYRALVTDGV